MTVGPVRTRPLRDVGPAGNRSAGDPRCGRRRGSETSFVRSGFRREYRRREHFLQRGRAGVAATVAANPFPQAVYALTGDLGVAGTRGTVVQRQIVTATAARGKFVPRPGSPPIPEPTTDPAGTDQARTDREAEGIQHPCRICIRTAAEIGNVKHSPGCGLKPSAPSPTSPAADESGDPSGVRGRLSSVPEVAVPLRSRAGCGRRFRRIVGTSPHRRGWTANPGKPGWRRHWAAPAP